MNVNKAEVKRLTVQDLGKKIEAKIEASKVEFHRLEGAKASLKSEMLPGIESVKTYWAKDLQEGKIVPEIAEAVFKALDQCGGCARNLIERADHRLAAESGKLQGLEAVQKECESIFNEEGRKIAAFQAALENGDIMEESIDGRPSLRVVGEHPGQGIASQRKSEIKTDTKDEAPPSPVPDPAIPAEATVKPTSAEAPAATTSVEETPNDASKKSTGGKKAKPTSAKLFGG